jgi:peptidase M23-like protein
MKRVVALLPVLIALQVGVQPALAWTWPVDGPVLRPFVLGDDPYAAGQHRGIDVAGPGGASVRAPIGGQVSFAGTVPIGGRTITIRTDDGYSVTLVHLGSTAVGRGAPVAEGEIVGTVGPSGDAEVGEPYVHLGVRLTSDPNGYLDPLRFLPARPVSADLENTPTPEDEPTPVAEQPKAGQTSPSDAPRESGRKPRRQGKPAVAPFSGSTPAMARWPLRRDRYRPVPLGIREAEPSQAAQAESASDSAHARPRSFDVPLDPAESSGQRVDSTTASRSAFERGFGARVPGFLLLGATAALSAGGLLVLRRQLRDAVSADRPPAVLLEAPRLAAEDARGARLAQQDRVVLDGDLESILLREAESLANLDGNDDAAELVDVPNDPRCRRASCSHPHAYRNRVHRPGRSWAARPPAR